MPIAYDPSLKALIHPEELPDVLPEPNADPLDAIALGTLCSRLSYIRFEGADPTQRQRVEAVLAHFGIVVSPVHAPATGTQGFVAYRASDKLAVVAIRGSQPDEFLDIVADVRLSQALYKGGPAMVHKGFLNSTDSIRDSIVAALNRIAPHRENLLVCGHSLGAAVATLLAMDLHANQLVTIGSPRVGDENFRQRLLAIQGLKISRIVNRCDIVTMLPIGADGNEADFVRGLSFVTNLAFGPFGNNFLALLGADSPANPYVHVGDPLYYSDHGLIRNISSHAMLADRRRALSSFDWNLVPKYLSDHAPINYLRQVWQT